MSTPADSDRRKMTVPDLVAKKATGELITMLTAYDYSSALLVDRAGIDVILVGDSLGMVVMGLNSTVPVTMEEMLHHCRAVARGSRHTLLVGDMPFMSYQASASEAVRNAGRFIKEGAMDAVKLEGGRAMVPTIEAITQIGIPVMGHIGLTPQTLSALGGYRVQGRSSEAAYELVRDAVALEKAGCFSVVLEAIPAPVAAAVSERLAIPTIGIGAGANCDGQVLVYHDLLGLYDRLQPRFVKQYAAIGSLIQDALIRFREEVESGAFPTNKQAYTMDDDDIAEFEERLSGEGGAKGR